MTANARYMDPQGSHTRRVLDAALSYRRDFGWSVIPTHPTTKKPLVRWEDYQRTVADEATINDWYQRWPHAGVAIVTGAVSGLWVVDVDSDAGRAQLEPLSLPAVPTVKTGKGEHRYFLRPGALRNTAKKVEGIDTRGDGGYVIAPPSIHPSGVPYAWSVSPWDTAVQSPPTVLVDLFNAPAPRAGTASRANTVGDEDVYARMLEDGSPAGQRHGDMVKLVGHYIARGLSTREIAVLLRPWVDRCSPPFPYEQLDATIRDLAAAEARKQARTADLPEPEDTPPTITAALRELITTQRAELADWKAQAKAWEALFMNSAVPDKAKKVLAHMHKRFGTPLGRPLPDDMPCTLYADEQDIKAHGLGVSAYKEGRDILLSLDLVTRQQVMKKIAPPEPGEAGEDEAGEDEEWGARARGKDWFYAWGLNAPAVNVLWAQLPTLTEIAPTDRQVKAVESRKERLERAIEQENPTLHVVRALKQEVADVRQERENAAYECRAATFERDNARHQAEAAARERDQALHDAQRIIREHQQPPTIMLGCKGCGTRIDLDTWRCDDCRAREREEAGDSKLTSNLLVTPTVRAPCYSRLDVNFESPPQPVGDNLKPCRGGCGTLTPHGWTCKPCREHPIGPLNIASDDATRQGVSHGL